jgi:hypothetical protein
MSVPNDILLPSDAKYISFVDPKLRLNPHYDIVWSFQIALTGTEHAFSTFLINDSNFISNNGHYLGIPIDINTIATELFIPILTESGENITTQSSLSTALLSISFDTTGFNALSTPFREGLLKSQIKKNSITIRDDNQEVIYHNALSALSLSANGTTFVMTSTQQYWQTLRFRLSNLGSKLDIDLKRDVEYTTILSLPVSISITNEIQTYVGFSFTTPVSSSVSQPLSSTLFLNNFHIQGNTSEPTYEIIDNIPFAIDVNPEYEIFNNNLIIAPKE